MRCVVEAGGGRRSQEVFHLFQRALRPLEASGRPSQVTHHVSISPRASFCARGAAKVRGRRVTVVDGPEQVADLVGSNHNARVGSAVLDKGNAADLRETCVANTCSTNIGVPCRRPAHPSPLPSRHVKAGQGYHHVVDWQRRPEQNIYICCCQKNVSEDSRGQLEVVLAHGVETGRGVEHVSVAGVRGNVGKSFHGLGNDYPGNVQIHQGRGHLGKS